MNTATLISAPRAQMSVYFDALKSAQVQEIENQASALSARAAWLAEYLGYRGAYGCGDHGHDSAAKAADKKEKRVRKALGYSYP